MEITEGDAERNLLGRTGPLRLRPVTFMGTTGLRGLAGLAIGHSNKERGNVITAMKNHQSRCKLHVY